MLGVVLDDGFCWTDLSADPAARTKGIVNEDFPAFSYHGRASQAADTLPAFTSKAAICFFPRHVHGEALFDLLEIFLPFLHGED